MEGVRPGRVPGVCWWFGVGQGWWLGVVDMPGGGGPGGAAVGVLGDRPAGGLFNLMVALASGAEIEFAGGSGAVCWVVGDAVVDVAKVGGHAAARELTRLISGDHESGQVLGWPIAGGAVVDRAAGGWVGEDAPPGAAGGQVRATAAGIGP